MKNFFYALLALSLSSCGGGGPEISVNQLAGNDFEAIDGWVGENTPLSLTKEKAHSGRYAVKVGPGIEYSTGYNNQLGKLSASKLNKIKVRAWVNVASGKAESMLVVTVLDPSSPGKSVMWKGFRLADQVKSYNKWVEIEQEVSLPDNVASTNRIGVFLWRTAAAETAYLDDLTIEKAE